VPFHHDPGHGDELLDRLFDEICYTLALPFDLTPGTEGISFQLGGQSLPHV
jgi:hypothetical protein